MKAVFCVNVFCVSVSSGTRSSVCASLRSGGVEAGAGARGRVPAAEGVLGQDALTTALVAGAVGEGNGRHPARPAHVQHPLQGHTVTALQRTASLAQNSQRLA